MFNQTKSRPENFLSDWQITQWVYYDVLQIIEKHFQEMAISFMPLKGAYLIASGLASGLSSRKMKDIDILVKKEDFQKAANYFGSLTETQLIPGYFDYEQPFIYHCFNRKIYLEIKYQICPTARFILSDEDLFCRGVIQNSNCVFPSPEDAMLIHVCHYLHHIYKNFDISFFEEIALLEEQKNFSWKEFWIRAEKTGIKPFVWLMISIYARIYQKKTFSPDWSSPYTRLLMRFSFQWYAGLNPLIRKILLEIPFVRRPLWLIRHKIRRSRH
ncbi:MAG: nucleotidyltransferase family protein [Fibrobacter sp.]|nr:nucleotidyltransferase family protein [Fibrobacter sp.]